MAKQKQLALKSIVASSTQKGDVTTLLSGGFWQGKGQAEIGLKTDEIQIEFLDMSSIAGVVLKTCAKGGIQSGIQLFVRTANANENPVSFPFQGSDKNGILHYGSNRKNDFPDVLSLIISFPRLDSSPEQKAKHKKLSPCLEKLTFLTGDKEVPEYTVQLKTKNDLIEIQKSSDVLLSKGKRIEEKVRYFFINVSPFHKDGMAVWLSQSGDLVVQQVSAIPPGKKIDPDDDGTRVESTVSRVKIDKANMREIEAIIDGASRGELVVKDRPGVPDEVRVNFGFRDSSDRLRQLQIWEDDSSQQGENIKIIFNLARRLLSKSSFVKTQQVTVQAGDLKVAWPAGFEVLDLSK